MLLELLSTVLMSSVAAPAQPLWRATGTNPLFEGRFFGGGQNIYKIKAFAAARRDVWAVFVLFNIYFFVIILDCGSWICPTI